MNRRWFLKGAAAAVVGALVPAKWVAALTPQPVNISVPITWSASRATDASKFALVKALMDRAIETHDRLIEEEIFGHATPGYIAPFVRT